MELYTLHDTGHSYVQSSAMDGMLLSPAPQAPPPYGGGVPLGGALLRGLDEAWRQDRSLLENLQFLKICNGYYG